MSDAQHVFIVGSKGIPGKYGGYETFVDKLTEYHEGNQAIQYHVACKSTDNSEFEYHGARCFNVKVPEIGSAQAIWYDIAALARCVQYIKAHQITHPIVYVLACRIGPVCGYFQKQVHKLGGKLWVNPDGHEWMRAKWSAPVRRYWKFSESLMAKNCDLLICDSKNIEQYIHKEYGAKAAPTTFAAYGAETRRSELADDDAKIVDWYKEHGLGKDGYYLVVGRFVPENNYEIMMREFIKSDSKRDFVLITNVSDKFLRELESRTGFSADPRIKFVGTVYDQELLMKIRENAYAYCHGHEVGGTNPSLLEALSSTDLNLLLDVGFNREVAEDSALYWSKCDGSLSELINLVDKMNPSERAGMGSLAKKRISEAYSWQYIADAYEALFISSDGED